MGARAGEQQEGVTPRQGLVQDRVITRPEEPPDDRRRPLEQLRQQLAGGRQRPLQLGRVCEDDQVPD